MEIFYEVESLNLKTYKSCKQYPKSFLVLYVHLESTKWIGMGLKLATENHVFHITLPFCIFFDLCISGLFSK